MINIQPVQIWHNGQIKEAVKLAVNINDNTKDAGMVYYRLLSKDGQQLAEGNLHMTGEAYEAWSTNEYAHAWVAEQLNLTIVQ